jgi:hypothetical protein
MAILYTFVTQRAAFTFLYLVDKWLLKTLRGIISLHIYRDSVVTVCTTKVFFFTLLMYVQGNCFKKNIKIYIKTARTCFDVITIIRERII